MVLFILAVFTVANDGVTITTEDNEVFEYNVPRSRHLNVEDGESVKAGDALIIWRTERA